MRQLAASAPSQTIQQTRHKNGIAPPPNRAQICFWQMSFSGPPSPLPSSTGAGEGESPAAIWDIPPLDWPDAHPQNQNQATSVPSPRAGTMKLLWGDTVVSTAVFGVSPKTFPSFGPAPNGVGRIIVRLAGGRSEQIVGRTLARGPTRATVALPDPSESFRQGEKVRLRASLSTKTRFAPPRSCATF
jgi:hypothetical protein